MGFFNVLDRALLQPGQSEDISKVLENFDAIATTLNGGIDDSNFAGGLIFDPAKIKQSAATTGQALIWDGAKWAPATPAPQTFISSLGAPTTTGGVSVANQCALQPLPVIAPFTFTKISLTVSTAAGNIDIGVYYSDDDVTFTRAVSKGSVACPASGLATITVASTTITPQAGRTWYLGFGATDNATFTFSRMNGGAATPKSFVKSASFPLPATITAMTQGGVTPYVMITP